MVLPARPFPNLRVPELLAALKGLCRLGHAKDLVHSTTRTMHLLRNGRCTRTLSVQLDDLRVIEGDNANKC